MAGVCLREEIIGDAGEAEFVIEAAKAGRNTGLACQVCGKRISPNGALLHAAIRVEYTRTIVVKIVATAASVNAIGILGIEITEQTLRTENGRALHT